MANPTTNFKNLAWLWKVLTVVVTIVVFFATNAFVLGQISKGYSEDIIKIKADIKDNADDLKQFKAEDSFFKGNVISDKLNTVVLLTEMLERQKAEAVRFGVFYDNDWKELKLNVKSIEDKLYDLR